MRGTIPLNLDALLKFSTALRVSPEQISPELSKRLNPSFLSRNETSEAEREGKPLSAGFFNSDSHSQINKSVLLPPNNRRLVSVDFICELEAGEFKKASRISDLNKKLLCLPDECSQDAFAIVYTGTGMGEILDHGQPILLDKMPLLPGNQYILEKDDGYMLAVFESESGFGQVFRKKGTRETIVLLPEHEC